MRTRFYYILWPFVGPRNTYTCSCSWKTSRMGSSAHRLWRGSAGWGGTVRSQSLWPSSPSMAAGPRSTIQIGCPRCVPPVSFPVPRPRPRLPLQVLLHADFDSRYGTYAARRARTGLSCPAARAQRDRRRRTRAARVAHGAQTRRASSKGEGEGPARPRPRPACPPPAARGRESARVGAVEAYVLVLVFCCITMS